MKNNEKLENNSQQTIYNFEDNTAFGDVNHGHTPLSNTGCGSPNQLTQNICFDYVKFRFNSTYTPGEGGINDILKNVYKVNVNNFDYDPNKHWQGYQKCYVFDTGTFVMTGGSYTQNADMQDTTIIEMKGSECRSFEIRDGDFFKLFSDVKLKHHANTKRLDIAFDDFTGILTPGMIEDRFNKGFFTSPMRNRKLERDLEEGLLKSGHLLKSKQGGWTMTIGGTSSRQLCVYNKLAERKDRGYTISYDVDSWMRYEMRFYDERADEVLLGCIDAMQSDTMGTYVRGLLGGMIELKADNNEDSSHMSRAPIYAPWEKLLNGVEKVKMMPQTRIEMDITKLHAYAFKAVSKTLLKLFLLNNKDFDEMLSVCMGHASEVLKNSELAQISLDLKKENLPACPNTIEGVQEYVKSKFGDGIIQSDYLKRRLQKTRKYKTPESIKQKVYETRNVILDQQVSSEVWHEDNNKLNIYCIRRIQSNGIVDYYESGGAFFCINKEDALSYEFKRLHALQDMAKHLKDIYPDSIFYLERIK